MLAIQCISATDAIGPVLLPVLLVLVKRLHVSVHVLVCSCYQRCPCGLYVI